MIMYMCIIADNIAEISIHDMKIELSFTLKRRSVGVDDCDKDGERKECKIIMEGLFSVII